MRTPHEDTLTADLAGIRRFGDRVCELAAHTEAAAAGAPDTAAALSGLFGPVGAGFAARFARAQEEHRATTAGLSRVLTCAARTAHGSAARYEDADRRHAELLRTAGARR